MNPAEIVLSKISAQEVATLCDVHLSRPYRWREVGRIPNKHCKKILEYSRRNKFGITAEQLL